MVHAGWNMCGITGSLGAAGAPVPPDAAAILDRMTDALRRRGPDSRGTWRDATGQVNLGHRRLAILDLTEQGHQPKASADCRFVITYNGEIYNFRALREELEAECVVFRGHSDTEVLLEGFTRWGIEPTLQRAVGMFALAVWDSRDATLHLARDRLGEKPLYFGTFGGTLLFGSDLRALAEHPSFVARIDRTALQLYLKFAYVPAPFAIYEGVRKLLPGHILTVDAKTGAQTDRAYWSATEAATSAASRPYLPSDEQRAVDDLEVLLRASVCDSMESDVPLGVFLSGGIDSSTIAALAQAESSRPIHTYTIGFQESGYNEADDARRVAKHLGTTHTEFVVTHDDARRVIPELPAIYTEPFADSSQIPTFLVSKLARAHVTVALSGDGGDELFGGYRRHITGATLWRRLSRAPYPARRAMAGAIRLLRPRAWDRLGRAAAPALPARLRGEARSGRLGERAHKLANVLALRRTRDYYDRITSAFPDPSVLLRAPVPAPRDARVPSSLALASEAETFMVLDAVTYLPDDIMTKVDRAAMANSLETRAPFLSHRVFELAWRLPLSMRIRDGEGKWALRQVLHRHVPRALVDRPKTGFGIPLAEWLRGPLRAWAAALIEPSRLEREGIFRPEAVARLWAEHLSGKVDRHTELWVVLMFQAWLEQHPGVRLGGDP